MAKHQIFLIHGMGEFEPGWSGAIEQQFRALFDQYPTLKADGFVDFFEFKEICYGQVFEKWRAQWRADAAASAAALNAAGLDSGASKTLVELAAAPSGSSFWQTHVLDVAFYRFLMPMAQEVWREVQTQIMGHLDSFTASPSYSIVAHSLGSAVAYETLHAMITGTPSLPSSFRPVNFFAVSNTARLLWGRGGDLYTPTMGPSLTDHRGMCLRFFNFRHALDPVCNVSAFHRPPDRWFSEVAGRNEVYFDVNLPAADLQMANVHALQHYLGHPLVHVPMLRRLAKMQSVISNDEAKAALADWRGKTLATTARQKAVAKLEALAVDASAGWTSEIEMLLGLRSWLLSMAGALADGES